MSTDEPTIKEGTATDRDAPTTDRHLDEPPEQARDGRHLTGFQQNILLVLLDRGGAAYGLAIKRDLETPTYYNEEVNHGRLYPNLDQLVEHNLIEKSEHVASRNVVRVTCPDCGSVDEVPQGSEPPRSREEVA